MRINTDNRGVIVWSFVAQVYSYLLIRYLPEKIFPMKKLSIGFQTSREKGIEFCIPKDLLGILI